MHAEALTIHTASDRDFRAASPQRIVKERAQRAEDQRIVLEYPSTFTGWAQAAWAAVNLYVSGRAVSQISADTHVPYDDRTWKYTPCKPIHTIHFGNSIRAGVRITNVPVSHAITMQAGA